MKVSELTGAKLNYWVARAMGYQDPRLVPAEPTITPDDAEQIPRREREWNPSVNWAQGGPIIEREGICVFSYTDCWGAIYRLGREDWIDVHRGDEDGRGPTPLIAAMRAYVASKFGDEVPDSAG